MKNKTMTDFADELKSLSPEEKAAKVAAGVEKIKTARGFTDEAMVGYVAATDDIFASIANLTSAGLLLPEQGLALVAILADHSMGRTGPHSEGNVLH